MNKLIVLLALAITCVGVSAKKPKKPLKPSPFVQMKDGHFLRNGKPYYYVSLWAPTENRASPPR